MEIDTKLAYIRSNMQTIRQMLTFLETKYIPPHKRPVLLPKREQNDEESEQNDEEVQSSETVKKKTYILPHNRPVVYPQRDQTPEEIEFRRIMDTLDYTKDMDEILDRSEFIVDFSQANKTKRKYMNKEFNEIWSKLYGFDIDFSACLRDINMLTPVAHAKLRNTSMLARFCGNLETVFDVFSGKGSDFFSWAMIPGIKKVYGNTTAIDKYVFEANRMKFESTYEQHKGHKCCELIMNSNNDSKDLYSDISLMFEGISPELDLLYLDPPWNTTQKNMFTPINLPNSQSDKLEKEDNPEAVMKMLIKQVIIPLTNMKITPQVIILKGRWGDQQMRDLAHHLPGYMLTMCWNGIPYRHPYSFYFFTYEKCKISDIHNGNYHNTVYHKKLNKHEENEASLTKHGFKSIIYHENQP